MANVRSKVAVASGKGGVGKSAVTANLAVSLASRGWRVGVLDADLNGPSMAKFLGVRGQRFRFSSGGLRPAEGPLGVQVVSMDLFLPDDRAPLTWEAPVREGAFVWRETMEATALRELLADTDWGGLDVLLVDLPPGAPKLPTAAELVPGLDGALVVTIPSEISRLVVGRAIELARSHGVSLLGLVENMIGYLCERCGTVGELFGEGSSAPADSFGLPCLGRIVFDPRIGRCADRGAPYVVEHPGTTAARAFADLAGRLAGALRGGGDRR
jgi:ATP-binding protein involved in chromosome partitioning